MPRLPRHVCAPRRFRRPSIKSILECQPTHSAEVEAIMSARLASPDGSELIGYADCWSAAPGERIRLMASSSTSPITVRLVRLRHGDPNPAGPGLLMEPVPSLIDGDYPCSPQTVKSGSFAVLDSAVLDSAVLDSAPAQGSALSVWAWTRLPARGRRQVLLARGFLELFLDA